MYKSIKCAVFVLAMSVFCVTALADDFYGCQGYNNESCRYQNNTSNSCAYVHTDYCTNPQLCPKIGYCMNDKQHQQGNHNTHKAHKNHHCYK